MHRTVPFCCPLDLYELWPLNLKMFIYLYLVDHLIETRCGQVALQLSVYIVPVYRHLFLYCVGCLVDHLYEIRCGRVALQLSV